MKICPACKSNNWNNFLQTKTGKIITGDQRITEGNLDKILCNTCGVASNRIPFTDETIERLYGREYELNTHGREEHIFYSKDGPIERSQVFADWIAPSITSESKVITEIGCGEGLFIQKLKRKFPEKEFIGFDGSEKAVALANKRNLNVKNKLIMSDKDNIPMSDIIILINVIEHIQNIEGTIKALKNCLKKNGRIVFCLPIQDYGGYDILFAEHVWHFTSNQFKNILYNNGLRIIRCETKHPINHGIGLFVCEINKNIQTRNILCNEGIYLNEMRDLWLNNFSNFNNFIRVKDKELVATFGSGEVFTIFYAFTNLNTLEIKKCIDETPGKKGTKKHNVEIEDLNWLSNNTIDTLIICTNKKYFKQIRNKVRRFNIRNIYDVYQ